MYEVCGEKELKVILALDPGDSISGVARKIDENRETIRRVVNRLEEAGYVAYDDGLHLVDQTLRDAGLEFLTASANISPPSIAEAYVLPRSSRGWSMHTLASMRSTSGPAVATKSLATQKTIRCSSPSTSPTLDAWTAFFDRFGIPTAEERLPAADLNSAIQVVLKPRPQIEPERVDGRPVISLQETVAFANEHYAHFQSALDMLGRMYDSVDTDANYRPN